MIIGAVTSSHRPQLHTHTHTHTVVQIHTQGHSSTLSTGLGDGRKSPITAADTVDTVLVLFRVDPF